MAMSPQLLRVMVALACLQEAFSSSFHDSLLFEDDKRYLIELLSYFTPCDSCFSGPPIPSSKIWSWSTDPCSDWYGVGCSQIGDHMTVTSLQFPPYYSTSLLVARSIGYLSNLTSVHLSVPEGYESCNYYYDRWAYWVEDLRKLKVLDVSHNDFSFPSTISYPSLTELYLSSTGLSYYDDFPYIDSLEVLDISFNFITYFPYFVSYQVNLTFLNASMNHITYIPHWFSYLTSLEVLDIRNCLFSGPIPDELKAIRKVYLGGSGFDGSNHTCIMLQFGVCVAGLHQYIEPVPDDLSLNSCNYWIPLPPPPPPLSIHKSLPGHLILLIASSAAVALIIVVSIIWCCRGSTMGPLHTTDHIPSVAMEEGLHEGGMMPVMLMGNVICVAEIDQTVVASDDEDD